MATAEAPVSEFPGPERTRSGRFFDRFTDPIAEMARDKIGQVEDKVRASVQAEIDTVSRAVRAKAVEVRPSALAFAAAALLTVLGVALLLGGAVVGLAHVVWWWLSFLLVGAAVILLAAGLAAWGRHNLPQPVRVTPLAPEPGVDEHVHPWAD